MSRNEQPINQEPNTEEVQQPSPQTPNEESTISSQTSNSPEQPHGIQENISDEEGTDVSFVDNTTVLTRGARAHASMQGQMGDEVHENHQRHSVSVQKTSTASQPVKGLEQRTFYGGETDSSPLESDKTAITPQARIFNGNHPTLEVAPEESRSATELSRVLTNDVGCVPATSLQDNISIEETTSPPKSMLLATGRHGGPSFKTKFPVHGKYEIYKMF